MRVLVFGAMHMKGKSGKTGLDYDMARLYVASDIRPAHKENFVRQGVGYEAAEVDCEPQVLAQLQGLTFPRVLSLETEMRMQSGKFVPCVTGILADEKSKTA